MGQAEEGPHDQEHGHRIEIVGGLAAECQLGRDKAIHHQERRGEGGDQADLPATQPGTEEDGGEKQKPDEGVEDIPERPLQAAGDKGQQQCQGRPELPLESTCHLLPPQAPGLKAYPMSYPSYYRQGILTQGKPGRDRRGDREWGTEF